MIYDVVYNYKVIEGGVMQIDADSMEEAENICTQSVRDAVEEAFDIEIEEVTEVNGN